MDIILNLFTAVIRSTTPLLFWALAVVFSERVGIWFLGVEGVGLAGALAGILGEIYFGHPLAGVGAAIVTGALLGYLMNLLLIKFPTNQTAIGLAFNTTMLGLTSFIYRLGGAESARSVKGYTDTFFGFNVFAIIAVILVFGSWWLLHHTGTGLKIRAVGESAIFAEAAGINARKTKIIVMIFAGILAALAGDALTQGWVAVFAVNVTAGRGFIGMAAVYLGRWNPLLASLACLVFGLGESLAYRAQASAFSGTSTYLFQMLPYVLTLLSVAILGQSKSPRDAGKPFIKQ